MGRFMCCGSMQASELHIDIHMFQSPRVCGITEVGPAGDVWPKPLCTYMNM